MSDFEAAKAAERIVKAIRNASTFEELEAIEQQEQAYINRLGQRYPKYYQMVVDERKERAVFFMQRPK